MPYSTVGILMRHPLDLISNVDTLMCGLELLTMIPHSLPYRLAWSICRPYRSYWKTYRWIFDKECACSSMMGKLCQHLEQRFGQRWIGRQGSLSLLARLPLPHLTPKNCLVYKMPVETEQEWIAPITAASTNKWSFCSSSLQLRYRGHLKIEELLFL